MPIADLVSDILKAGAFLGGLAALWGVYISRRNGVKGDERAARSQEQEAKRDTVKDRDDLVDQLQEEVQGYRGEVAGFRVQLTESNANSAALLRELSIEREYSRLLLDWGYRGAPPPPPRRPNTSIPS